MSRPSLVRRRPARRTWILLGVLLAAAESAGARGLDWDETDKEYAARLGETGTVFEFRAINNTPETVEVFQAVPSCGCTVVHLPVERWLLAPGESGVLKASVDFTGKHGEFEKTIEIRSSAGTDTLRLRVRVPEDRGTLAAERRMGNERIARGDRQAVFRNACASCHVPASAASSGASLFQEACAICHESPHRAEMVPDLAVRGAGQGGNYWRPWIESGREGSLMPAFALKHQGILTPAQVDQLVAYLVGCHGKAPKPP
jgi:mono/diheme cytochrome c family protein